MRTFSLLFLPRACRVRRRIVTQTAGSDEEKETRRVFVRAGDEPAASAQTLP